MLTEKQLVIIASAVMLIKTHLNFFLLQFIVPLSTLKVDLLDKDEQLTAFARKFDILFTNIALACLREIPASFFSPSKNKIVAEKRSELQQFYQAALMGEEYAYNQSLCLDGLIEDKDKLIVLYLKKYYLLAEFIVANKELIEQLADKYKDYAAERRLVFNEELAKEALERITTNQAYLEKALAKLQSINKNNVFDICPVTLSQAYLQNLFKDADLTLPPKVYKIRLEHLLILRKRYVSNIDEAMKKAMEKIIDEQMPPYYTQEKRNKLLYDAGLQRAIKDYLTKEMPKFSLYKKNYLEFLSQQIEKAIQHSLREFYSLQNSAKFFSPTPQYKHPVHTKIEIYSAEASSSTTLSVSSSTRRPHRPGF